jgi:acetyl-CoA carboxylase biotin carboxylase subunit
MKEAIKIAGKVGYPVLLKATSGGGGKGIRPCNTDDDLKKFFPQARLEAEKAFGDPNLYLEKMVMDARHIEFQVLADNHGNCIHLFERECSVQRRHQKVIEETPSPIMTPEVRDDMGKHAVAAAKAVKYSGAGTIEFIVDDDLNYYFLEMNTRLQVEHPITERVVNVDLVKEQIKIANNEVLSLKQDELKQNGHAIEARIYAEDPDKNFMPNPGLIKHITEPLGLGVRHDGYVYEGYEIPIHYDPLISKLIVWAPTRDEAIERMKRALYAYKITGIKTSIPFLNKIMDVPSFKEGRYNTHFIQDNEDILMTKDEPSQKLKDVASIAAFFNYIERLEKRSFPVFKNDNANNWKSCGRKKNLERL